MPIKFRKKLDVEKRLTEPLNSWKGFDEQKNVIHLYLRLIMKKKQDYVVGPRPYVSNNLEIEKLTN